MPQKKALKTTTKLDRLKRMKPADPLTLPEVRELTDRFWKVRSSTLVRQVDSIVEMGNLLLDGQAILQESYPRWVRKELKLDRTTAWHYTALAEMAQENPRELEEWKPFGVSRLYRVAHLPAEKRAQLFKEKKEEWKRPDQVDDRDFREATDPGSSGRKATVGSSNFSGIRRRIRSLHQTLEGTSVPPIRNKERRREFRKEISDLVRSLRDLHGTV